MINLTTTTTLLNEIEDTLYAKAEKIDIPIIDEDLGVIIFFATQYRNTKEEYYKQKALALFNTTIKVFVNHDLHYSLVHGFEGIFWVVNYLTESGVIDNEDCLKNLEPHLLASIEYDLRSHNYNLLHGCLGKIQYYLYSKNIDKKKSEEIINKVIQSLYDNKIEENNSINWKDLHLQNGLNIGYFNGQPTVLKLLVRLKELGYQNNLIDELIDKLINVLVGSLQFKKAVSIRGKDINEGHEYYNVAGLHGDLTLAHTFYYAGLILKREDLKETATQLTRKIAAKDPKNSGVMYFKEHSFQDIGMSHGLGGITYLLFKLNNWIQDSEIQNNLEIWNNEFLINVEKVMSIEEKILMPEIFQKDENEYPYDRYSLLEGVLGSAFVITTMEHDQDDWGNYLTLY